MPSFPTLAGGETVHQPFTQTADFQNVTNRQPHGWQYSYNLRSTPLRRWTISYSLSDADLDTLLAFWNARKGAYEEFSFTDPDTTVTYSKCRFAGDGFRVEDAGPNEHLVTIEIHEYA